MIIDGIRNYVCLGDPFTCGSSGWMGLMLKSPAIIKACLLV